MGVNTSNWLPMRMGAGVTVFQTTGETRLVVDCRVKPTALDGHARITLDPYGMMEICGGGDTISTGVLWST